MPASDNDNPAAPNTGKALLRRFCFEVCFAWGIVHSFPTPQVARGVGRFKSGGYCLCKPDNLVARTSFKNFRNFLTIREFPDKTGHS